jgi:hypothetical protein
VDGEPMKKFFFLVCLLIGSPVYAQIPPAFPISPVSYGTAFPFVTTSSSAGVMCLVDTTGTCVVKYDAGAIYTQNNVIFGLGTSTIIQGNTNGKLLIENNAANAGVLLDFATDSILKVQSRAAGNATVNVNTVQTNQLALSNAISANVNPAISSGFGTSPSVPAKNGTAAFSINVGTGGTATSGVINLNLTAANGWSIKCEDITTQSTTVFITKQIANTTTTATIANYNTAGAQAAWVASDILNCMATAF